MRVLHVGWGFSPWRTGGLIYYAEDLMAAQADRGYEVAYFFSGRHYPRIRGPRLKRWRLGAVRMLEVINGPIVSGLELGTHRPELDISEPRIEAAFERVLRSFRPDVVHIQELLCLPSSLIEVTRAAGVPTVMTLQDYYPLCSTLRLFDAQGRRCERLEVGDDCAVRNARAPRTRAPFVADTMKFEIGQWHQRLRVGGLISDERYDRMASWAFDTAMAEVAKEGAVPPPREAAELAPAFQRRRDVNVQRLGLLDRAVAQSRRLGEIYVARGVDPDRLTTLPFTLAHIERLRPRVLERPPEPLTFATLGGCASPSKGSQVVAGALRHLREVGLEGRFRLWVFGDVDSAVRAELDAYAGVEAKGSYTRDRLDQVLDGVDVGIIPSMWEEALGYTGFELLAKAIPLVANPLGGITEYAREGETAWLNTSCSADGLAEVMSALIDEPGRVLDMHRRIRDARAELVLPFTQHVDAIESVYGEVI